MQSYFYRNLGKSHGAPRLWLEGSQPERAGFTPGVRYTATLVRETKTLTLTLVTDGQRVVSRKTKGGKEIPVIDLNSHEVLGIFEGCHVVRVVVRHRRIHILPAVSEIKRRERLERLQRKHACNEPLLVGSLAHGVVRTSLLLAV